MTRGQLAEFDVDIPRPERALLMARPIIGGKAPEGPVGSIPTFVVMTDASSGASI